MKFGFKLLLCMTLTTLIFTGCGETIKNIAEKDAMFTVPENIEDLPQFQPLATGDQMATIKTTMGDVTIKLFPEQAPKAVENFITHANEGYYNGVIFHRVIPDFMIQGGDPLGTGTGGESIWGEPFEDEFSNLLRNFNGALSMANSGTNTNGSQFFIVQNSKLDDTTLASIEASRDTQEEVLGTTEDGYSYQVKNSMPTSVIDKYAEVGGTPHLDFVHTVFGQVVEGMDIVNSIAKVETESDKPIEDIIINSIEIYNYE